MTVYADSSFLVSLYLTDGHSPEARRIVTSVSRLWCTPLHQAEWAHAIAQHVFRGVLDPSGGAGFQAHFDQDSASGLWQQVAIPEHAFDLCADLARRYGAKLGLRTLDSLHVASALELKAARFWTFDERQAKLARAMGMKTG